jgi:hypothetical protein
LRWWQALAGGILVGFASYFYEAGLAIPLLIVLAMFWSNYQSEKLEPGSNLKRVLTFSICMAVAYGTFLGFHLRTAGSQISTHVKAMSFFGAAQNTWIGLWKQGVVGNLGFPPRHTIGDIFYLQGSEPGILPILAITVFLVAVAGGLRSRRRTGVLESKVHLLLIFLTCAVSYYGIIAVGRFNLYVVTQSRYFYLPDAFLVLVFSWPMTEACSVRLEQVGEHCASGRRDIFQRILYPQTWAMGAVCILIALNAYHVFQTCREIARTLSPVREAIETVKSFASEHGGGKRLYVDFVPQNLGVALFGGTHIALETTLSESSVLTRDVGEAEYIYTGPDGIVPNPAFKMDNADSTSFTIEFDYVMWGELITVIHSPENTIRIRQWSPGENEILLRLTYSVGEAQREIYMTARHPRHYVSHIVIQQQNGMLYIVEEGQVIAVKRVGEGEFLWRDDILFLGTHTVFPPQYCYLENFFACVGKAKYDLQGLGAGELAPGNALRAPMPALNSDPIYWNTG